MNELNEACIEVDALSYTEEGEPCLARWSLPIDAISSIHKHLESVAILGLKSGEFIVVEHSADDVRKQIERASAQSE